MKRVPFFLFLVLFLSPLFQSSAQLSVHVNAGAGLQMADWSEFKDVQKLSSPFSIGLGYDLEALSMLDADYSIGLSAGYMTMSSGTFMEQMAHAKISDFQFSSSSVPALLSLKMNKGSVYADVALGANFWTWSFETKDGMLKDYQQGANFVTGLGAGYLHEISSQVYLTVGLQYYYLSFGFPRDSEYTYNFYIPSVFKSHYLGLNLGLTYKL